VIGFFNWTVGFWADIVTTSTAQTTKELDMIKFTTEQLQDALVALYSRNDIASKAAYEMTFDEVAKRMGDEAFDAWCESVGF
jgi:hypothetical protein